jgi:hypothetical protein
MSDNAKTDFDATAEPPRSFSAAARAGLVSARENALPGFILWLVAAAIVAGFYFLPPVTAALERLGRLKVAGGFLYSIIATGLFGGFIPFVWQRLRKPDSYARPAWKSGLFLTLFWSWKGFEVDLFYRLQAMLFGSGATAATIIPKVLVDQFVYNPLWAGWTQVLAYWWLAQRFRPAALVDKALWSTMGWRVVTVLISTWAVWIPMVSIIYAVPSNLQIPLFNIVLCFWSLMLGSLTKEKKAARG